MPARLRDIPFLPVLLLLHLIFTVSSLFLRTYELLTTPAIDEGSDHDEISNSRGRGRSTAPGHVGVVFHRRAGGTESTATFRRRSTARSRRERTRERARVVECVLNLVRLAAEEGVEEMSIFERSGLLQSAQQEIMAELMDLPISPPASGESSPARAHSPSRSAIYASPNERSSRPIVTEKADLNGLSEATTLTVFSGPKHCEEDRSASPTHLKLHLLPSSSSDIISTLAHELRADGIRDIAQASLHERISNKLHFHRDPDLLIIHDLAPLRGWRSWLPRPAPELGGYPFWPLRITEIYHHSPELPFLGPLRPLLHLARTSTLPFLRKLGRLVPPPTSHRAEELDMYDGPGRLGLEEWEGAMRAWSAVEQRLGR